MGHSQQDKAASHDRVVRIAAARFREAGLGGPGVADLMQEAGLTHGGFYRHFGSRDDLVAEAVEHMRTQFEGRMTAVAENGLTRLIDEYLTENHRDAPATGCAVVAVGGDMARSNQRARAAYTHQVELYLELIGELVEEHSDSAARQRAIVTLSAMVGSMLIARAVNKEDLSREFLDTVRHHLTDKRDKDPPNRG
jgi:TetR/AcrR family transcriptional repressor of nem operon